MHLDRDKNRDDDSSSIIGDLIEAVGCGGGMVGTIQQIQLAALTPWRAGPPRKKDEKSLNILKVFISLKKRRNGQNEQIFNGKKSLL